MILMYRKICYFLFLRCIGSYAVTSERIRGFLFKQMTRQSVHGLVIKPGVYISGYSNLVIGNNVSMNHNCLLSCEGGLTIGNNVSIAHGVSILTTEHAYEDSTLPIKCQPLKMYSVTIGDDVWIGAKATILAGVHLANGTVVAAGAVVTKSISVENEVVGGVPARLIKKRFATAV